MATSKKPNIWVETSEDVIYINKMPGAGNPPHDLLLTLRVHWPTRSIWQGKCSSAKRFDFFVSKDGKEVWRWSAGKMFAQMETPIQIPGGNPKTFATEIWSIDPKSIRDEGLYVVGATFEATGDQAFTEIEIRFAV